MGKMMKLLFLSYSIDGRHDRTQKNILLPPSCLQIEESGSQEVNYSIINNR
jgi:hypothetical protein